MTGGYDLISMKILRLGDDTHSRRKVTSGHRCLGLHAAIHTHQDIHAPDSHFGLYDKGILIELRQ